MADDRRMNMTEDRRTKPGVTPGEDPREIDREKTTDEALDELAGQNAIVHDQPATAGLGTSADAPGRDLEDLTEAHETRDIEDSEPDYSDLRE